jgi:hypothetical protein
MPEQFQRLKLRQYPSSSLRETGSLLIATYSSYFFLSLLFKGEARYWKTFIPKVEEKFHSSPNCIDFDPTGNI